MYGEELRQYPHNDKVLVIYGLKTHYKGVLYSAKREKWKYPRFIITSAMSYRFSRKRIDERDINDLLKLFSQYGFKRYIVKVQERQ